MNFNQKSVRWFFFALALSSLFVAGSDLAYDFIGGTFAVLSLQSLFCIAFIGTTRLSLVKIYYVFTFIFLSLIPWVHYSGDTIFWGGNRFSFSDYLIANCLLFLANALVATIYCQIKKRARRQSIVSGDRPRVRRSLSEKFVLVFLSVSSFGGLLAINNFSLVQLFFRGLLDEEFTHGVENSSLMLLLTIVARLVPFFCFLYSYTSGTSGRFLNSILFLLLLVCVFPTGVARYMVGFVYIPVLLVVWPRLRNGLLFASALVLSIFLVFPFLNQFRSYDGIENLSLLPSKDFFFEGHFDAYQNFARAIQVDFVTYGEQLLGALLFFVPRVFWPEKPVGSGYELSVRLGYDFSNISMPFLAEGYVNFGLVGVFVFAAFAAVLMAKLDMRFSSAVNSKSPVGYSGSIYFYLCGATFFILRGDLLSSFAYVVGGLFSAYFVALSVRFFSPKFWRRAY